MKRLILLICLAFSWLQVVDAQKSPPGTPEEMLAEYNRRIKLDSINGIYIPKNVEDAIRRFNILIDAASMEKFKTSSEEIILTRATRSLGKWMIINWSLYEGSRLVENMRRRSVYHPDDIVAFVLISYHRTLNGKPLEEEARIKEFQVARKKAYDDKRLQGPVLKEFKVSKDKKDTILVTPKKIN